MSEGKVHKWAWEYRNSRENVHDEDGSSHPYLITDDLVASLEARIRESWHFIITDPSNEFPEVSRSALYKFVSEHLQLRELVHPLGTETTIRGPQKPKIWLCDDVLDSLSRRKRRVLESDRNWRRNTGLAYHAGIEATEHGIEIHSLTWKGEGQTDCVSEQNHGLSVFG